MVAAVPRQHFTEQRSRFLFRHQIRHHREIKDEFGEIGPDHEHGGEVLLFAAAVHAESFQIHRAFGGVIFEHRVKGFAFNVQVFVDGGGRGRSTENEGRSGFK